MKFFKYIYFALALVFVSTSCEDYIGGDINADPDKPNAVPPTAILPNVEIVLADVTGGAFSRFNCMFMQQVEGVARQWAAFNQYGITPNRFDAAWQNVYENALIELQRLTALTTESGSNHYTGVANILTAYTLMIATDNWGDMPYTEALLGTDNLNPVYDDQATVIYPEIFRLLDEAITLFAGPAGPITPGSEDVIYSGNIDNWLKAAYAARARAYLHQGNYANALADAQRSFTSAADNFAYEYEGGANSGQWYRFNRDRTGDIEFHPTMGAILDGLNDTKRKAIFEPAFIIDEHPYLIAKYRQDMISYREIKFIEAEALLETGGSAVDIEAAYLEAINASFAEVGLTSADADEYTAQAVVNPGAGNITLENIITQKYIGLFVQPEVFNDWKRTGIPSLTPVSGSEVPVRWLYSSDEFLFNENAPSETEVTLFSPKVDWDN